jgi:hypothetical protein
MTRPELLPLEGQWVRWLGMVDCWAKRPSGDTDICIRAVKLWPWDFSQPLDTTNIPLRTDHLWLRCPAEFVATLNVERLRPANGIGTVGWYRRADGTTDLGVRAQILANAGDLKQLVTDHLLHGEWLSAISLIDEHLAKHRAGRAILCAPNASPDAIVADLEWSRRLATTNLERLAKAPRRQRCASPGRFRDLLHSRR